MAISGDAGIGDELWSNFRLYRCIVCIDDHLWCNFHPNDFIISQQITSSGIGAMDLTGTRVNPCPQLLSLVPMVVL